MVEIDILEIIKNKQITHINQLIQLNLCSSSTIRRKLKKLEKQGFIEFLYGGKIKLIESDEISLEDEYKFNLNRAQKNRLGKMCGRLVKENEVIFIDNGTTVRYILKHLENKNVTIYTNGYNHIKEAEKYNLDLRIIPGKILYKEASIVGEEALLFLQNFNFDVAFIGANGFSEIKGVTTPNQLEAFLKFTALKISERSYFVIDSKKYGLVSKYKICEFDDFPIITLPVS